MTEAQIPSPVHSIQEMHESENPEPIHWIPLLAILVIVGLTALRPGDAPWLLDEPMLIRNALTANATPSNDYGISLPFTLAHIGLSGTHGMKYGPVPEWIYQVMLACTHNLIAIMAIRCILVNLITGLALFWLARSLRISPWLAVVVMLSPWLMFYSRELWDNSFSIAFGALALASYADFLATCRKSSFIIWATCLTAMILTHFMAVALIIPMAAHMIVFRWREAIRLAWIAVGVVAVVNFLAWPYWSWILHNYASAQVAPVGFKITGWIYPFLGAHHLTAFGTDNIMGANWFTLFDSAWPIIFAAQWATLWVYPVVWAGMALSVACAVKIFRFPTTATVSDHLGFICLFAFLAQCVLDGYEHVDPYPHYFNATWIIYLFFLWLVLSHPLVKKRMRTIQIVLSLHSLACVIVAAGLAALVIRNGGDMSEGYGTTLGNQVEAARQVLKFNPDSHRFSTFYQWNNYLDAPQVIAMLYPPPPGPRPKRDIHIFYRHAFPGDVRVVVEDSPANNATLPATEP
jgi:hypothetical protein